ncbi:MAG: hypothetical protein IJX39_03825 [Clostridia bacterium]|nr:hypothetical protein [Clostridia bacterium]
MKKIVSILLAFFTLIAFTAVPIFADTAPLEENSIVTFFDNGSYLVQTVSEQPHLYSARSTTYTKTGNTNFDYYNKNNEHLFRFTITGTFHVVEGVSSTCTDSTYSYSIYDSSWKLDSASTWKSDNTAYGNAVFKDKFLFATIETVNIDAKVICDIYGNISF